MPVPRRVALPSSYLMEARTWSRFVIVCRLPLSFTYYVFTYVRAFACLSRLHAAQIEYMRVHAVATRVVGDGMLYVRPSRAVPWGNEMADAHCGRDACDVAVRGGQDSTVDTVIRVAAVM